MNFAVELTTAAPGDEDAEKQEETKKRGSAVKTGDTSKILLFSVLTLAAGLVCAILAALQIHRSRNEQAVKTGDSKENTRYRRRR